MREIEFKMERPGPAVAMSACYKGRDRLKSDHGIVKEIKHNDRGYYVIVNFDE